MWISIGTSFCLLYIRLVWGIDLAIPVSQWFGERWLYFSPSPGSAFTPCEAQPASWAPFSMGICWCHLCWLMLIVLSRWIFSSSFSLSSVFMQHASFPCLSVPLWLSSWIFVLQSFLYPSFLPSSCLLPSGKCILLNRARQSLQLVQTTDIAPRMAQFSSSRGAHFTKTLSVRFLFNVCLMHFF